MLCKIVLIFVFFQAISIGDSRCPGKNECTSGEAQCSPNASCKDTRRGYKCKCNPGYRGNGKHCEAINSGNPFINLCGSPAGCCDVAGNGRCCAGAPKPERTCADDSDCPGQRRSCINNRCRCEPGCRLNDNCDCVEGCPEYGDSFSFFPDGFVPTSSCSFLSTFFNYPYMEYCFDACRNETSCNAVMIGRFNSGPDGVQCEADACFLVYCEPGAGFSENAGLDTYFRDCA